MQKFVQRRSEQTRIRLSFNYTFFYFWLRKWCNIQFNINIISIVDNHSKISSTFHSTIHLGQNTTMDGDLISLVLKYVRFMRTISSLHDSENDSEVITDIVLIWLKICIINDTSYFEKSLLPKIVFALTILLSKKFKVYKYFALTLHAIFLS